MSVAFLNLKRALKNGGQCLSRSKLLSLVTVLVIALIFFVFNVVLALRFATESVLLKVGEKIDISADIQPGVEDYTIETAAEKLKSRPEIKDVILIRKEDALERLGTKYPNVIAFLEANQLENPLPTSLRIVSRDLSDNNAILAYLGGPEWSQILDQEKLLKNEEQKTRNERVLDITRFIRSVGVYLNFIFALVTVLILLSSVSLTIHAYQKEIHIMQLVGARHGFIRGGFLFLGVFYTVAALILSVFFSQLFLKSLTKNLLTVISNESLLVGLNAILIHFEDRFLWTFLLQLMGAALLGLFASALATQLYLKKRFSFS